MKRTGLEQPKPKAANAVARAVLAKILPPSKACARRTYTTYVKTRLADDEISVAELQVLCRYYRCTVDEVTAKIVNDRMGKG